MKQLEEFQVRLERDAFLPGDVLCGSVSFILRLPIKAKSLAIHFEGEGLAVATPQKNRKATRQFMYLDEKVAAFNKSQPEVLEAFQTPGKHTFFFCHRLQRNLPGSFSYSAADHDASISYSIYAVFKKPKRFGCKQTITRADVVILKTQDDYDFDFDDEHVFSEGKHDCSYKYVSLDELRQSNSNKHRQLTRVATKLSPRDGAIRGFRSYSESDCLCTTDIMTNVSAGRTAPTPRERAVSDSHSDVVSLGSMGSDGSHRSSQISENNGCVRSRHRSVADSRLDDDNEQEYIVKVLRASDIGKETGDIASVDQKNISNEGGRRNSLFKTVIII